MLMMCSCVLKNSGSSNQQRSDYLSSTEHLVVIVKMFMIIMMGSVCSLYTSPARIQGYTQVYMMYVALIQLSLAIGQLNILNVLLFFLSSHVPAQYFLHRLCADALTHLLKQSKCMHSMHIQSTCMYTIIYMYT